MNRIFGALAAVLLISGCSSDWSAGLAHKRLDAAVTTPDNQAASSAGPALASARARAAQSFANAPDLGSLVQYPAAPVVRRSGAYTWHAAKVSEAHALRSMVTGQLDFTAPDGTPINLAYERHIEHPDGNWSWIGRLPGERGESTVITFGESATFGTIPQGGGQPPLRLTIADGRAWVVSADPRLLGQIRNEATHPTKQDFLVPPKLAAASAPTSGMEAAGAQAASTTASGKTVVDVLVGFTDGFAAYRGGASAAVTRVHNLVDVTNQAYVNSQVNAEIRLVHAMQVSYPDATANKTALEEVTGFKAPSTRTTPAPAFAGLRSARDQYGADLVVLLRRFQDPENDGCGIAWLIGGGRSGIDSSDEFFGYSVVSDGQDTGTDGKTYFCREETFAHELGHNMGSQHDSENAKKDDGSVSYGAYSYSFGYRTTATGGDFYTVMAYGDSGQTRNRVFSNPNIAICGKNGDLVCGVADQADNARSLNRTIPTIAGFRATAAPIVAEPVVTRLNLFSVARQGSTGTESHVLGGVGYQSFVTHLATALHRTGSAYDWRFQVGDYNRDGFLDIFVIAKMGGSLSTEIHVLNGADNFQTFLLHAATVLHQTGTDNIWVFKTGDYNRDGILDMYAIGREGGSGRTEVHVLDGATQYSSFLAHIATVLPSTGGDGSWDFALGDYNKDGLIDLFAVSKLGGSSTTELHVLNGAGGFQGFLLQTRTALHMTGSNNIWSFKVADYNGDGALDLFAINKKGGSGQTEVHVLDGSSGFLKFSAHIATALHVTDDAWEFELGN